MTQPIDFGRDLSRDPMTGQDPLQAEATGLLVVAQACACRLIVANGSMPGDKDYGYLLADELDDDVGPQESGRIGATMDAEFRKDQRVAASETAVTITPLGNGGMLLMATSNVETALGPFSLTFALSTNGLAPVVSLNGSTTFSLLPMLPLAGIFAQGPVGPAGPPGPPGAAGAGAWNPVRVVGPTTVAVVANTVYYVDVTGGAVVLNGVALALGNGFEVAYVAGDLGVHSLTVNAPGGVTLSQPPPAVTTAASIVFNTTLPPNTTFSLTWVNAGVTNVYSLV